MAYGNKTYSSTELTVFVAGDLELGAMIEVQEDDCPKVGLPASLAASPFSPVPIYLPTPPPPSFSSSEFSIFTHSRPPHHHRQDGCVDVVPLVINYVDRVLLWSDNATWANRTGRGNK